MSAEALELEIERAWVALCSSQRKRRVYLTRHANTLFWGRSESGYGDYADEVGTYETSISLRDFRDDVFFVADQCKHRGRRHG